MMNQKLAKLLGATYPLIQAPMAGGPTTPALVAAVSNAGAIGSIGAGYMTPEALTAAMSEVRRITDKPFAVNLFVPQDYVRDREREADVNNSLADIRQELG